jgi:hypothetical protein
MPNENLAPSPGVDTTPEAPAFPGSTPASPLGAQMTVDAARARRDAIIKDPVWRDRYVKGDSELAAEMRNLNLVISEQSEGNKLDQVLAGTAPLGKMEVVSGGELPTTSLMQAVEELRKSLPDEAIKELIEGAPGVSQERHDFAARLRAQLLEDREWCGHYRSGNRLYREQMTRINAVLSAPIIAEPK